MREEYLANRLARSVLGARVGGRVERCHGIPHHGSYNNAAHSWGVAMLMKTLWPLDFPRLAYHCLAHDIPEGWMGDIPAPTMRYVPGLKDTGTVIEDRLMDRIGLPPINNLSEEDHAKLKACDWIEFYLWCREQFAMGNQFAMEGEKEILNYIKIKGLPRPADILMRKLEQESVIARQSGVMKSIMEVGNED